MKTLVPSAGVRTYVVAVLLATISTGITVATTVVYFSTVAEIKPQDVAKLMSVGAAVALCGIPVAGRLARQFGSKPVYLVILFARFVCLVSWQWALSPWVAVAVLTLSVVADRSIGAVSGGFIAELPIAKQEWAGMRAYLRSVSNLGIGVGGMVSAAFLSARSDVMLHVLIGIAALGLLVAFVLVWRTHVLPVKHLVVHSKAGQPYRDRRFLVLTFSNGVLAIATDVLAVAVPTIVLLSANAPIWVVGMATTVNTILIVFFQVWVSDKVKPKNMRISVLAGVMLLCVGLVLIAQAAGQEPWIIAVLVLVAVVVITGAELILAAASFQVSYDAAPAGEHAEYQAVFSLGFGLERMLAPIGLSAAINTGFWGWAVFITVIVTAGVVYATTASRLYKT